MFDTISLGILVVAGLFAISIFTSLISTRVGTPLLLVFLGVGLLAGEDGIGGLEFDDAQTAYLVGSLALAIILYDSGFDTSLQSWRTAAWPAVTLATAGVLLTAAIVGAAAALVLSVGWLEGLLLGAIVSSTDAAAVFFLLRVGGITLRERVRSTLEIESGSNDPMAVFLTLGLVTILGSEPPPEEPALFLLAGFLQQFGLGALFGVAGGLLIVQAINRVDLERSLYPLLGLSLALSVYGAAGLVGGSGFLAAYVAGLVVGNSRLRATETVRRFQRGMTWLTQIAMFVALGLLATPSQFPKVLIPAAVIAAVLILIARPAAVWLCLRPFRYSRNETAFVAWVGLRGAVSILLAILPLLGGLPMGQTFFNVAFLMVLASLMIQGWTIRPMARWLTLIVPPRTGPVERVELELPGNAKAELVAYRIAPGSPVTAGARIPRWARPSLIVRNGVSMNVHTAGRLMPGDYVYLFIRADQVPLLDRLFASPATLENDDRLFFGDFAIAPEATLGELAATYGIPIQREPDLTIGEFLRREFGGRVEVGDRLAVGPVELIVRSVTEDHQVSQVGLAVEPAPPPKPHLPRLDWLTRLWESRW